MTLIVTLKGKDGMVFAADSRGTLRDSTGVTACNDAQQKVHILAPHVVGLFTGQCDIGAFVIERVQQQVAAQGVDEVVPVLRILQQTVRTLYTEHFPAVPAHHPEAPLQAGEAAGRPELGFIVGGYELDGTPHIYGVCSELDFAPLMPTCGFAVQGACMHALYLLNRLYEAERAVQDLAHLASYVISETASQDGAVGGPVSAIIVKPGSEGCHIIGPETVWYIQEVNWARSQSLRDSFYMHPSLPGLVKKARARRRKR